MGDLLVVLVVQDEVVLIDDDVGHTGEGRESSGLAGFYLRAEDWSDFSIFASVRTSSF